MDFSYDVLSKDLHSLSVLDRVFKIVQAGNSDQIILCT